MPVSLFTYLCLRVTHFQWVGFRECWVCSTTILAKKTLQMGDTETAWSFFHRFFVERLKPNHYSQRGKPSRILRHGEPAPRTRWIVGWMLRSKLMQFWRMGFVGKSLIFGSDWESEALRNHWIVCLVQFSSMTCSSIAVIPCCTIHPIDPRQGVVRCEGPSAKSHPTAFPEYTKQVPLNPKMDQEHKMGNVLIKIEI